MVWVCYLAGKAEKKQKSTPPRRTPKPKTHPVTQEVAVAVLGLHPRNTATNKKCIQFWPRRIFLDSAHELDETFLEAWPCRKERFILYLNDLIEHLAKQLAPWWVACLTGLLKKLRKKHGAIFGWTPFSCGWWTNGHKTGTTGDQKTIIFMGCGNHIPICFPPKKTFGWIYPSPSNSGK